MIEPDEPSCPNRLTIGIETRSLVPILSGGIVNTQIGVFQEVFARYRQHRYLVFCLPFNRRLFEGWGDHVELVEFPLATYFDQLERWLAADPVEILFRAYPGRPLAACPAARQIVYMPDNQHDFLPGLFDPDTLEFRRLAFGDALARAGAIATISEFSRATLAAQAPRGRDIFLMPPALQRAHEAAGQAPLDPAEAPLVPSEPFFYYPANLWPHKNHDRILAGFRAFTRMASRRFCFVLTGDRSPWPAREAAFADLDVRHLGFVSPTLVNALMRRAEALVFFSLFEGFGAPLLEAFHAGTPVLCSPVASLPEIAGDAALMADPTDSLAMAAAMRRITADPALRATLIARGRARLSAYSWARSAATLIQACARVAARARDETASAAAS